MWVSGAKFVKSDLITTNFTMGGASFNSFTKIREIFSVDYRYFGILFATKHLIKSLFRETIKFVTIKFLGKKRYSNFYFFLNKDNFKPIK